MTFDGTIANPHLLRAPSFDGVYAEFNAWSNNDDASPYAEPEHPVIALVNAGTYTCPAPPGSGFTDAECPIGIGDHDADVLMGEALELRQFYRTFANEPLTPPQHPLGYYLDSGVIDLVTVRFESDMAGLPAGIGCTTSLSGAPACEYPADHKGYAGGDGVLLPKFEATGGFTDWEFEEDATNAALRRWDGWLRRTDPPESWPYADSDNGPYFFRPEEIADMYVGVESAGGSYVLNLTWRVEVHGYGWYPGYGPNPQSRLMMVI